MRWSTRQSESALLEGEEDVCGIVRCQNQARCLGRDMRPITDAAKGGKSATYRTGVERQVRQGHVAAGKSGAYGEGWIIRRPEPEIVSCARAQRRSRKAERSRGIEMGIRSLVFSVRPPTLQVKSGIIVRAWISIFIGHAGTVARVVAHGDIAISRR